MKITLATGPSVVCSAFNVRDLDRPAVQPIPSSVTASRIPDVSVVRQSLPHQSRKHVEMNGDSQSNGGTTEQQSSGPQASNASFHPPTTTSAQDVTVTQNSSPLANSVVRDLLRVYESLTQSSTPQVTMEDSSTKTSGQASSGSYGVPPPMPTHPYGAQLPMQGYAGPPSMFHLQSSGSYPHSQQPHTHQAYYADNNYGQQPYAMPPNDHTSHHGFMQHVHEGQGHQQPHAPSEQDDYDDEGDDSQEGSGRSKRKRRGSENSGSANESSRGQRGRKKSKAADGRWSKRFTWPEDLHRDFVSAIFDVGLKHSSPSTILEHMPKHEQITTERIKSHLQKYRMHRVKSKKEFISSYEASLRDYQKHGGENVKSVTGAAVAAQLTHEDMTGTSTVTPPTTNRDTTDTHTPPKAEMLMLPQLTDSEKASPIGSSMGYLMGLFFSLKQQLMMQRAAEAAKGINKPDSSASATANTTASGAPDANFDTSNLSADGNTMKPAAQSVRTNIEENTIMKREMQNQMALQNKMRALKQQELNKYKNLAGNSIPDKSNIGQAHASPEEDEDKVESADHSLVQGAGEMAGNDDGNARNDHLRGLSIGNPDEFWNTDVVDEQLFEFLMNN